MDTILKKITDKRLERVAELKKNKSIDDFIVDILARNRPQRGFRQALLKSEMAIIAEVKKASPSKGILSEDFPYLDIAKSYEQAGASAISVLTEPDFFLGNNAFLDEISHSTTIPILRKDFIVDEIQLYEAKAIGADAVLLISGVLVGKQLKRFIALCDDLQLDYIVEVHNEEELADALQFSPKIIGINNRNLKTFEVSLETTKRLASQIPNDRLIISESGIFTKEDVERVSSYGAKAILVGESLIKSGDIKGKIKELLYG